jgi:hypothetical protein
MAKLRINGDSSGYVDLEAPNAASSSTLDLDQVPQKNVANTFSTINKFADSVSIGGTHSPTYPLDVRSTGQAIVRVDGVGLYFNGIKIRNNYSSVQSDWNVGAAGGSSGWGSANGTFIIRDDTTNSTGLEIEQGAGSNTAALHINSSGHVTSPSQPSFTVKKTTAQTGLDGSNGAIINWDVALHNIGGHYNLSTNRFTAPVAGRYQFSAGGNIFHYSGTGTYYWRVVKNGGSGQYYAYTQRTDASNVWIQLVLQNVIIDLDANDYIDLFLHASNSASKLDHSATNHWSFYSGHLLG